MCGGKKSPRVNKEENNESIKRENYLRKWNQGRNKNIWKLKGVTWGREILVEFMGMGERESH